jgi:hypothetical protein
MRPAAERRIVAFIATGEANSSKIADITGIPRSTVRDWLKQPTPLSGRVQEMEFEPATLPEAPYSYLLGFYLGDGCISKTARGVYRLRIKTDTRYPAIIDECAEAMRAVCLGRRVHVQRLPYNAVEIGSYSKLWPLLFPQHGPGPKHKRKIELVAWQEDIVERHPREFLRGLIHSDGCRVLNRVDGKAYPRYFFAQVSDDIKKLFCEACDRVGVAYRHSNPRTVSIARAPSVALLDSFIGPKA